MSKLDELIRISRFYGSNTDYVIAGGGNTSYKDKDKIWIKASGISLANIDENGFVFMSRSGLNKISLSTYETDPVRREAQIKHDLQKAVIGDDNKRPSVETSLHNLINHPFVVHTHPTIVNALLCSVNARTETEMLFGQDVLFVEYSDPGYTLFKKTESELNRYRATTGTEPAVVFLQNHGMIVGGRNSQEISLLSDKIDKAIRSRFTSCLPLTDDISVPPDSDMIITAVTSFFNDRNMSVQPRNNMLIQHFVQDSHSFKKVNRPFTPDNIVYCKSEYLFTGDKPVEITEDIQSYSDKHSYLPKIIGLKGIGLISVGESMGSANISMDVFLDMMKVSFLSENFGGPHYLTSKQTEFIDNWEVENYRRKVSGK